MSHWAELDENNFVIRVLVGDNNDPNGDEGYKWLIENLGGTWIKTSYNAAQNGFRKNFAGVGSFYDSINDIFINPKPFPSWLLNNNFEWQAPKPMPIEGNWIWDESKLDWVSVDSKS